MNVFALLVISFFLSFFVVPKIAVQVSNAVLGHRSVPLVLVLNLVISLFLGYMLGTIMVLTSGS